MTTPPGRTRYISPADVLRKFDPTLTISDLENGMFIGGDHDRELVTARIDGAEDEFEDLTRSAYREVRVGQPGHPETYEHHDASFRRYQDGVRIWLNNRNVIPLNSADGDSLEIRTGRDRWRDITDATNRWDANYADGWIRVYGIRRYAAAWRNALQADNIRVSYRHGALGGSRDRGGQTTLTESVGADDTELPVQNAGRLPSDGMFLLNGQEYVRATRADPSEDIVHLAGAAGRGLRGTEGVTHDAGGIVHYCPLSIREAIAARAAIELLTYDDWVDQLVEASEGIDPGNKVEQFQSEWEQILNRHAEVRTL